MRLAYVLTGSERHDTIAYLEILTYEVETLLAPFGIDPAQFLARWPVRPKERYDSPSRPAQRRLDTSEDVLRIAPLLPS